MSFDRLFFARDGFTTLGMVVALIISLSLIFSAAQVYRLSSTSADIQDVADAAALAAEGEVAEYMIVVRVADAIVLSLSLTGAIAIGIGIVALCVPATAPMGESLIDAGIKVLEAREKFARKAQESLDKLQKALPFLAAAAAANVAVANSSGGSPYLGIAILASDEGEPIEIEGLDGAEELERSVEEQRDAIEEESQRVEELADEANAAKREGWLEDCGLNPDYCMYERASTLAGMSGSSNPYYSSPDTWDFGVAMRRAKAYYPKRLAQEAPQGTSVSERANSALRKRFYNYASREIRKGYVHESDDEFSAFFPHMPKNTSEMRGTSLYTEQVYPISVDEEGVKTMHAFRGCPGCESVSGTGSISMMDGNPEFTTCPYCEFRASSMGKVAAASTSIRNGFEYHYEAVARACERYQAIRNQLDPLKKQVKGRTEGLLKTVKEMVSQAGSLRIDAKPPGSYGAIALVVNLGSVPASAGFESSFVQSAGSLGGRAAASAATLVADPSGEGKSVLTQILDNVRSEGGVLVGVSGEILELWSNVLYAYGQGQSVVLGGVESVLNSLPLSSKGGLGTWAARRLTALIASVGLQPAKLDALKPVLVNTAYVAGSPGATDACVRFLSIKTSVLMFPMSATSPFASLVTAVERQAYDQLEQNGGRIEIATIEPLGSGGPSIPITIALPSGVRNAAHGLVESAADAVRSAYSAVTGVNVWE